MNCNLDGTRLTTADIIKIGLDAGVFTDLDVQKIKADHDKRAGDVLKDRTAKVRFDLFLAGKLNLDTAPPAPRKPRTKLVVDPDLLAFFGR